MERPYAAELNDQNLSAIFEGCDDFIRRELWAGGQAVYAYAIDGLVASGDIGDFILKPLAEGLLSGTPEERYRQALAGRLYNAVGAFNKDALQWLTWCGAEFLQPFELEGEKFYPFEIKGE